MSLASLLGFVQWLSSLYPKLFAEGRESKAAGEAENRKKQFLEEVQDGGAEGQRSYGYDGQIEAMRKAEFSRLEKTVYLDHAGATLYSELQLKRCLDKLGSRVFINPHTKQSSGDGFRANTTGVCLDEAREAVLSMFNTSAEDYFCIFTSGATAGLKLVGETFPWTESSSFLYNVDNHNSVLGIRNYALDQGSAASAVQVRVQVDSTNQSSFDIVSVGAEQRRKARGRRCEDEGVGVGGASSGSLGSGAAAAGLNLFAYPAESNFSGVKYNLELIEHLKRGRCKINGKRVGESGKEWFVLLDAAKACCTSPPNLSDFPADFVVFSFYKIFGYPSGLGALLVRKDSAKMLHRRYFGGGALQISVADEDFFKRREGEDGWEDGTLPFLSIQALQEGFAQVNRLSFLKIEEHTRAITEYAANRMIAMQHFNGQKVCELYGNHRGCTAPQRESESQGDVSFEVGQGPVIAFNLLRSDASYVGYREFETLSEVHQFVIRTGCLCNPGACAMYLKLSAEELKTNFENGHVCWDDRDIIHGKPTGAIRISFGYMSTFEDADAFLQFLTNIYVERGILPNAASARAPASSTISSAAPSLSGIFVYPIKSCQGFCVKDWPLLENGLYLDRQWAIKDSSGAVLTQKKEPKLAEISTMICRKPEEEGLGEEELQLQAPGMKPLVASIKEKGVLQSRVEAWLMVFLERRCKLVPCDMEPNREGRNFSNKGGCLLISVESVKHLIGNDTSGSIRSLSAEDDVLKTCMQFRPNFLMEGGSPFQEESWSKVSIGGSALFDKTSDCSRCRMVCIDQRGTGDTRYTDLLAAISKNPAKRKKGIVFGILLSPSTRTAKKQHKQMALTCGASIRGVEEL